jgi:DNA polymerase-3 subunit alpha
MCLLSEVFDRFAKLVTVNLLLTDINPDLIARIRELAKNHKGKCNLRFQILDDEEKIFVELPSRKLHVDVKEYVVAMEKLEFIKYKIE